MFLPLPDKPFLLQKISGAPALRAQLISPRPSIYSCKCLTFIHTFIGVVLLTKSSLFFNNIWSHRAQSWADGFFSRWRKSQSVLVRPNCLAPFGNQLKERSLTQKLDCQNSSRTLTFKFVLVISIPGAVFLNNSWKFSFLKWSKVEWWNAANLSGTSFYDRVSAEKEEMEKIVAKKVGKELWSISYII